MTIMKPTQEKPTELYEEPKIKELFPTPVMWANLNRAFTEAEWQLVEESQQELTENIGNTTSTNRYVLNDPRMVDIKKAINHYLNKFMQEIMVPKHNTRPYITQSWINYTEPGQFHHKHAHPSSYLSGVLYLQADAKRDKISFYKDGFEGLKVPTDNYNSFNSRSWWFKTPTGSLAIFPSSLTHMVDKTTSKKTRISLSFNTYLEGAIGDEVGLTALHLQKDPHYD